MSVHAPELWQPKPAWRNNTNCTDYLRANVGVDPIMLAEDLGLKLSTVLMRQRKLGLRKLSCHE